MVLTETPIPADALANSDLSSAAAAAHLRTHLTLTLQEAKGGGMGTFDGWMIGQRVLAHVALGEQRLQTSPDVVTHVEPVRIAADRVEAVLSTQGAQKDFEETFAYDVAFNAAVKPPRADPTVDAKSGRPLPVGGGEPGRAYRAFNTALLSGDLPTIKKLASGGLLPGDEDLRKMLPVIQRMAPTNVNVLGGFVSGRRATLQLAGDVLGGDHMKGSAQMILEAGVWRLKKESW